MPAVAPPTHAPLHPVLTPQAANTADEVRELAGVAKKHGLAVHMDGARFANAAASLAARGVTPAEFTWRAGVDVLSLGGTKSVLFATEAVVFFNRGVQRSRMFLLRPSSS